MRTTFSLHVMIGVCLFFMACKSTEGHGRITDAGDDGLQSGDSVPDAASPGSGDTAGHPTVDAAAVASDASSLGVVDAMAVSAGIDTAAEASDVPSLGTDGGAQPTTGIDAAAAASDAPSLDLEDGAVPTTASEAGAAARSDVPSQGWQLVWSDEFSDDPISTSRWNHEVNCWGGGNNEQECYVADTKNSFVSDGFLHIVALADSPTGTVGGPSNDPTLIGKPYSSARLNTQGLGDWKYGRIEVRAQLPSGQGLWPAIWMLPTDSVYGTWAQSGEIDIMEAINLAVGNNTVYGTLHYGGEWPNNVSSGTSYNPESNAWETFHVYAIEWEDGEIRWFVDDVQYATQRTWYSDGYPYPAPFDQRFYLVLNLSVGGQWPGPADAQTIFPGTMLVDFVRVYQCSSDPAHGKGCGKSDPSLTPLPGIAGPDAQ